MTPVDEEQLVKQIARGDRAAFEELYRRTSPWLAVCLRRRCADDELVAEVMRETYLAVWRAAGAFAGAAVGGSAVGWLWTIAARRLVDALRLRRQIGYLPQEFGFYRRFTVREFVEYMAWLKEMPAGEVPGAVQRAIDRVALTDRADHRMKTLSGGMVRRVGIAQAIVNDPRILLLDEPTAGLDPDQRLQFWALLRELATDTCVLVCTHLVEDVAAACTDVLLIDEGRLVFKGVPADLAAAGGDTGAGDSAAERGYSAIMRSYREQQAEAT